MWKIKYQKKSWSVPYFLLNIKKNSGLSPIFVPYFLKYQKKSWSVPYFLLSPIFFFSKKGALRAPFYIALEEY